MMRTGRILQRKRQKRGAIDFDLPEPFIVSTKTADDLHRPRAPNIANRIIEEFIWPRTNPPALI